MEAVTERRWVAREFERPTELVSQVCSKFGLRPMTAGLLMARGCSDTDQVAEFLDSRLAGLPDPSLMLGMEVAVARLADAITAGEPILVHGDYDVDGISGASMLVEVLSAFGANVDYFLPLRLHHGYGLSAEAIRSTAADGTKLILSVDCGISAHEEAELAAQLGIDLIITDHHHPPEDLPRSIAILNPLQPGCQFPFKSLAGVGVAFFLLVGLRRHLRDTSASGESKEFDLRRVLDLVALGTIADLVPLRGLNRTLAKQGLKLMSSTSRSGIKALKKVADVKEVNCGAVGFRLAPRLNAAGRLEDAALGVKLLLSEDEQEVGAIAGQLDQWNRERQDLEKQTLDAALLELQDAPDRKSIVLGDDGWHQGVIGIVASRLVERFHRPTVLVAFDGDDGKGSARSAAGFHLYEGLAACSDHLTAFGGHAAAAGLGVTRDSFASFAKLFEQTVDDRVAEEDLMPTFYYDEEITLDEVSLDWAMELEILAPFGIGNPEPIFMVRQVEPVQVASLGKQGEHLRFTACQGGFSAACVAFGMMDQREMLHGVVDMLCTVGVNRWNGRESLQLRVKALRPTEG